MSGSMSVRGDSANVTDDGDGEGVCEDSESPKNGRGGTPSKAGLLRMGLKRDRKLSVESVGADGDDVSRCLSGGSFSFCKMLVSVSLSVTAGPCDSLSSVRFEFEGGRSISTDHGSRLSIVMVLPEPLLLECRSV